MRFLLLIFCLIQSHVQASDWLERTVRVDLMVTGNRRVFDPRYDSIKRSDTLSNAVNATNGQYPWSILTVAWSDTGSESRLGNICSGTLISGDFLLMDYHCTGYHYHPPADTIETFMGSAQLNSGLTPTNLVRHYWHITPSPENRPRIVLARLHETVTFNPNIHPIPLPSQGNFSYEGWSSLQLGYETGAEMFPAYSQTVHTSVLSNDVCNLGGFIDDHEMCGTNGGELSDTEVIRFSPFIGGALFVYEYNGFEYMPVLIGMHLQEFANSTGSFGHATRVSNFVGWIEALSGESEN